MSEQDDNETNDDTLENAPVDTADNEHGTTTLDDTLEAEVDADLRSEDEDKKLSVEVQVKETGSCERHIVVTVSREDIDRYKDEAYDDLMPKAQIPGFRIGRAPRKLVETRFKGDVTDQIKGSLIMDAMSQVTDDQSFSAISEPDFDYDAVQMPEDGELTFEFSVEVRPEFDMPQWKGLELESVVHEYSDEEVGTRAAELLQRYGKQEDVEGDIEAGDVVDVTIAFEADDEVVTTLENTKIPVRGKLTFSDGEIDGFEKLIVGASKGDRKETTAQLSDDLDHEDLAGKQYTAKIKINGATRVILPDLTPEFLEEIGGFESEDDLNNAVREELERQLTYHQQQRIRRQITEKLTAEADWDLPPQLLRRQSQRELQRSILELQAAGFPDEDIRRQINRLQQNLLGNTEQSLKEHFILERIAEDHDLDASAEDVEGEIMVIAMQQDTSPRRVRAQLEKRGDMDALRNQIVERKAIELITSEAKIEETELPADPATDSSPVSHAISGIKPGTAPVEDSTTPPTDGNSDEESSKEESSATTEQDAETVVEDQADAADQADDDNPSEETDEPQDD